MTFIDVLYGFKCPRRQERQVKFALKRKKENKETVLQEKNKQTKKSGRCYIKCLLIYVRYKSDFLT